VRVGADREDGVQAFAVDTRSEPWAPLTGRLRYRLRLVFPELPIAQGEFRLYVFLGDETALHLHDLRIIKPGFTIVAPDYAVGLLRPRHVWTVPQEEPVEEIPAGRPGRRLIAPVRTRARASEAGSSGIRLPLLRWLRWRRAIPAEETREVSGLARAAEALSGVEIWVIVRDESALPWPASRFPVPGPGRVLVAGGAAPGPGAAHTLREWQAAGRPPEGGAASSTAGVVALAFRTVDFPPLPGETVCGFIDRLTGAGVAKGRDPAFGAFVFDDPSGRERPELTRHIPAGARRLLDVGCGAGGSSAGIKSRVADLRAVGIESDRAAAGRARGLLDEILVGDAPRVLEDLAREGRRFDAFLFADVLEHLEDPVRALSVARSLAEPGATLVASVPNAGHLSLVRDLVLGRFDPVPAGLADAGHLRWFTKGSLADALEEAGWRVVSLESWPGAAAPESAGFLAGLERWPGLDSESLRTYQWIAVARPASVRVGNSPDVPRKSLCEPPPDPESARAENQDLLLFSLDAPLSQELHSGPGTVSANGSRRPGRIVRCLRVHRRRSCRRVSDRPPERGPPRHLPRLPAAGNCRFDFEAFVRREATPSVSRLSGDGGAQHLRYDSRRSEPLPPGSRPREAPSRSPRRARISSS
jgi:SAM-dependent methyltransferase